MPYFVNRQCLPDTATALIEWQSHFPIVGDANFLTLNSSSINVNGLVTWSINQRPITGTTAITRTGTTQLPACALTYDNNFDVNFGGLVFCLGFTTVIGFFYISRVGAGILRSAGINI